MTYFPVRFERVAAAFNADVARVRLCESSGNEHSPDSSLDLTDLVKSFMEKNEREEGEEEARVINDKEEKGEKGQLEEYEWFDSENREILVSLLEENNEADEDDRNMRKKIRGEVDLAHALVGDRSSPEFKRRLMNRLRQRGLDAGLCKSKWDKNGRYPGGDYDYVDVHFAGNRYIVEVSPSAE